MIRRITLADCSAQIGLYLSGQSTHAELVEWARHAVMAVEMPPLEQDSILNLLQDIATSSPESLARAAREYRFLGRR